MLLYLTNTLNNVRRMLDMLIFTYNFSIDCIYYLII